MAQTSAFTSITVRDLSIGCVVEFPGGAAPQRIADIVKGEVDAMIEWADSTFTLFGLNEFVKIEIVW